MCVHVTKTANRFEISSLLEKILLKQVRWCLTFVGLYIMKKKFKLMINNDTNLNKTNNHPYTQIIEYEKRPRNMFTEF